MYSKWKLSFKDNVYVTKWYVCIIKEKSNYKRRNQLLTKKKVGNWVQHSLDILFIEGRI